MPNYKGFQVRVPADTKREFQERYLAGEAWKILIADFPGSESAFALVVQGLKARRKRNDFNKQTIELSTLVPAELGWIAGIIDGEGWVGLTTRKDSNWYMPRLGVTSTTLCMQNRLFDLLGGCVYKNNKTAPKCKPTHTWCMWASPNVGAVLKVIEPYLIVKRKVAQIVLRFCERHIDESHIQLKHQDRLDYKQVRSLNARGTYG